jgi:DNA-binding transcriptional LysR family regulator
MNTDQLRLFLAIARHRSLARTAAELSLGPATVSERLKALEAEIGAALFERRGRGVTLSPAGEAFRPHAERALEVLNEAQASVRAASAGQRGHVTIAVTVTSGAYLLAPALVAFRREHPQVEVRVRSAHSWDAPGLVLDGLAELALISGPCLNPNIETLATFTGKLALVAGKAHPRLRHHFTLRELAREQWIVSFWGPASQRFLDEVRAAGDGQTSNWMELSPVELVKGMLLAGVGISLAPEVAVRRELASGELAALALDASAPRLPPWEISLIRHRRPRSSPALEALAQTLIRLLPELTR